MKVALISVVSYLTIIILAGWIMFGYRKTYYALILLSLLLPITAYIIQPIKADDFTHSAFVLLIALAPVFALLLSVSNLFRSTGIPVLVSVLVALLSILFCSFVIFIIYIAGVGMMG